MIYIIFEYGIAQKPDMTELERTLEKLSKSFE
jgi:hypothetical protein